jgi:hypothetical protein
MLQPVEIIRTRQFLKDLKRIGVTAAEQAALEAVLAANPQAGAVIPGLGGLRKVRFAAKGKGKSGGGRAIYLIIATAAEGAIALLTAYAKNEQSDLTSAQRKTLLALMEEFNNG